MTKGNMNPAYKVCKCSVLVAFSAMFFFPVLGQGAPSYYDASGQTAAFTLTPGAKSGSSAIRREVGLHSGAVNSIRIAAGKNLIGITLSFARRSPVDVAIYNVAGKRAFRQRGFNGSFLRLDARLFAPGLYSVVVRKDGQNYSRYFTVSR
jgi:hypothetical protein